MIRRFCEWYTKKFPAPRPLGMYDAAVPWKVVVTIKALDGITTWEEVEEFTQDEWYKIIGDPYWRRARHFAMDRFYYIKEHGYTHWVDKTKKHYPLHRIHLVEAMPSVQHNV